MPDETVELTPEQVAKAAQDAAVKFATDKAVQIGDKLNPKCKVFPVVLRCQEVPGTFVTGYARKPDLITQCKLIDKSGAADTEFSMEAAVTAIIALLIPGECDSQLTDTKGDYYDLYIKGAAYNLIKYTTVAVPVFF